MIDFSSHQHLARRHFSLYTLIFDSEIKWVKKWIPTYYKLTFCPKILPQKKSVRKFSSWFFAEMKYIISQLLHFQPCCFPEWRWRWWAWTSWWSPWQSLELSSTCRRTNQTLNFENFILTTFLCFRSPEPTRQLWALCLSSVFSFTCLAICLFLLYMFGHLFETINQPKPNQIFCSRFAFGAGASPLLWVFMGEIIPADYKVRTERVGIWINSWKLNWKFFSFP